MILRTQNIEPFLSIPLEWATLNSPRGMTYQVTVSQATLREAGFVLHWTHDGWRIGKVHAEQGLKYCGCGKEGNEYILVLRSVKDG